MEGDVVKLGYCDMCRGSRLQPVWTREHRISARLCAAHTEALTGVHMPELGDIPPIPAHSPLPETDLPWTTVTPYLRARMRPAGLEVRGFQGSGEDAEPVDGCGWLLNDDQLCELVVLASVHADEEGHNRALVLNQLHRILRGNAVSSEGSKP